MRSETLLFACFAFAAVPPPALAHVTFETRQAAANSNYKAVLQVPHGCKESPTVRIRVRMPDGVTNVKPQPKPGWKLEVTRVKSTKPIDAGHGQTVTETVSEVSWSGGELPNDHFEEFAIMMKLPERPGATLYFPVVQDCKEGTHRWVGVPEKGKAAGDLNAPALTLTPKR